MKKLKKLSLKKETIVRLEKDGMSDLKGGTSLTITVPISIAHCTDITKGNCDLHTIGHDDGPNCVSKSDWGWCWCYGQ